MITIHKYALNTDSEQVIEMPQGAMILSVHAQCGKPYIWVIVNTLGMIATRKINIALTGGNITTRTMGKPIGTVLLGEDSFVIHVFDGGEV